MTGILAAEPRLVAALRSRSATASLLRGVAGSCVSRVLANGLMFLVQIVFARQMGHEGFGIYTLALAWLAVLAIIGRLGYDLATVRFVATYHAERAWPLLRGFLVSGHSAVIAASAGTAAVLALGATAFRAGIGDALADALTVTACVLPVLALIQLEAAAVRGLGRVAVGDLPLSIGHPLLLLGGFAAAVAWLGAPATATTAMAAYFCAAVLTLAALGVLLRRELPDSVRRVRPEFRMREWLSSAPAMMLMAGFGVVLNQSSVIVVGVFSGPEAAGIYGAAARIAAILQIVVFSLIAAIGPLAARLSAAGAQRELQRAIDVGLVAAFAVALVAALAIAILGEWLLGLFGTGFAAGYSTALVLVGGQLCAAAMGPAGILLNVTGHQNASARILAIAAATNLALCAALTAGFGLPGAAVATALTTTGLSLALTVAVRRRLGLRSWIPPDVIRVRTRSS